MLNAMITLQMVKVHPGGTIGGSPARSAVVNAPPNVETRIELIAWPMAATTNNRRHNLAPVRTSYAGRLTALMPYFRLRAGRRMRSDALLSVSLERTHCADLLGADRAHET